MKKFGKLLLSVLMTASMVACSSSNSGNTETGTTQPSTNEQFDIVIIGAGVLEEKMKDGKCYITKDI